MFFVGIALFLLGIILAIIGSIWTMILAFMEHIVWGVAYLFIPLAPLAFFIMKWHKKISEKKFLVAAIRGNNQFIRCGSFPNFCKQLCS